MDLRKGFSIKLKDCVCATANSLWSSRLGKVWILIKRKNMDSEIKYMVNFKGKTIELQRNS